MSKYKRLYLFMKSKQERYRIIARRDNVLQEGKPLYRTIKNNWNTLYFSNQYPIVLELACGRGEYTIGMATKCSNMNFIGMDIKGDRLWKGSTIALEHDLINVAFLRASILDIENFFGEGEVDEIWITFPDPRPKRRDVKRRLTHPRFLDSYKKILSPKGLVRLKTDATAFFDYTLQELSERADISHLQTTYDLYTSPILPECVGIQTHYEKRFLAQKQTIKYLRFQFVHSQS